MAIVVDELEVVPAPEPGDEGGVPAGAPAPPTPEEIERALRRRAERTARLGAW